MKTRIKFIMQAPLSHIGETASNGSYFQSVLTSNGRIPCITANAIRGHLRDNMAMHLLDILGVKVRKDVFHILFSGGNINGALKDDIARAKRVRDSLPSISLLGAGIGDMILAGKLMVSFAYPVCKESEPYTGIDSADSWHTMIDEIEFTRTNDAKNDQIAEYMYDDGESAEGTANQQMRFSVQYMRAGTELVTDVHFADSVNDLELGAFYAGLIKWFNTPKIGGMSAKGFGFFDAEVGSGDITLHGGEIALSERVAELVQKYEDHMRAQGPDALAVLTIKKGGKNGKKSDAADEGDS